MLLALPLASVRRESGRSARPYKRCARSIRSDAPARLHAFAEMEPAVHRELCDRPDRTDARANSSAEPRSLPQESDRRYSLGACRGSCGELKPTYIRKGSGLFRSFRGMSAAPSAQTRPSAGSRPCCGFSPLLGMQPLAPERRDPTASRCCRARGDCRPPGPIRTCLHILVVFPWRLALEMWFCSDAIYRR